ncbi:MULTISPECIES: beta-ketoacyl synthase N-terminal-like domain-containing protein [Pseudomonas]|uniref:Polyketide synthase PksN/rhizoxin synthesis polyketide synthase RhiD n=1 Tax=Pseudomonas baetica TaxID=674054 RepID=A0ABX4Q4P5_9PSED|nr:MULTISPECIES: beta-ketoacyl synthase N-terminal-like domain-containing protein [Pseudomonas]MDR9863551.1 beta-ketoacyl synthase N-terminal-like domain-containing protein [Pseudomonas baetica]PKA71713.1 polyketide synthase PksN/rhizoxin synthesis polyketide synthase RhiD [Pseudomonas baetica]
MTYLNAFIDKVSSQSISDAQALDLIRQLHESVQQPAPAPARGTLVEQQVLAELSGFLVATIHLDQGEIEPERSLADYGFNSISLTEFSQRIGARFPGLRLASSTFMEHPSLAALARHIAPRAGLGQEAPATASVDVEHVVAERLQRYFHEQGQAAGATVQPIARVVRASAGQGPRPQAGSGTENHDEAAALHEDIAIIGMAARLPKSDSLADFWRRLVDDEPFISEVPADRWDWRAIYGDLDSPDKTDCYHGAFIDDVRGFDPLHFNIAPREAALIDPQHRLMLQTVWEALETSGYQRDQLRQQKIGVFLGIERKDYADLIRASQVAIDGHLNTGNAHAMLVNRIAHYFDWKGPVSTVDAACSSSFVAIDRAITALRTGQAQAAIAGGVNLVLSPEVNIYNRKLGLFTGDGIVRPFDKQANGHFFSDGLGVVMLKRLSLAERDNDNILGVIKGLSVRHGGKSLYLTAPNAEIHCETIAEALGQAGLQPRDIDYIEAQGTANPMADEVELNAFDKVFKGCASKPGFGTLKGQLGHFSGASGVISLIKSLLALQHDTLVKIANLEEFNWNPGQGEFACEPIRETAAWAPKTRDGQRQARHIGIHNFGFGGVTGHMVLGEYLAPEAPAMAPPAAGEQAVPLSARTADQLEQAAKRLLAHLQSPEAAQLSLRDVASTLQTGREHFEHRAVVFADSLALLTERLERLLSGQEDAGAFLKRDLETGKDVRQLFASPEMQPVVRQWLDERNQRGLGRIWVAGVAVDWQRLYAGQPALKKAQLPTYPFARHALWIPQAPANGPAVALPAPILQHNVSTFMAQKYRSEFTGQEPWFVAGGADLSRRFVELAHLPMLIQATRQAAEVTADEPVGLVLHDIVFPHALWVERQPVAVELTLVPGEHELIDYRLSSPGQGDAVLHIRGQALFEPRRSVAALQLPADAAEAGWHPVTQPAMVLLQLTSLLAREQACEVAALTLLSVDEVRVDGALEQAAWLWLRPSDNDFAQVEMPSTVSRLDIDICDGAGEVLMQLRDLVCSHGNDLDAAPGPVPVSMPEQIKGMIPTLNGTGAMTTVLPACSQLFVEFAATTGREVMDMGCAYGVATIAALEQGARVLAVDIEEQHLRILADKVPPHLRGRLSTLAGALPDMDFAPGRFQAIHAARVLHFLAPQAFRESIRKMARWLAPGGQLFLTCDTPYFPHWAARVDEYERLNAAGEEWPGYIADIAGYFRSRVQASAGNAIDSGSHASDALNGTPLINLVDPEILARECRLAGLQVEEAGYEGLAIDFEGHAASDGLEHASVIAIKPCSATPRSLRR